MTVPAASLHVIVPDQIANPEADLTADELRRADAFRFSKDRNHWIACRAALRRALTDACGIPARDVPIILGANGKPALAPPFDPIHFNLSHCEDLGLIAIDSVPVGIDLEPLSRAPSLLDCETSFCHPREIAVLSSNPSERSLQLLTIWTAKEAVLKALGTGLLHPPEEIFVDLQRGIATSDHPVPGLDRITFEKLDAPALANHSAFLARSPG